MRKIFESIIYTIDLIKMPLNEMGQAVSTRAWNWNHTKFTI